MLHLQTKLLPVFPHQFHFLFQLLQTFPKEASITEVLSFPVQLAQLLSKIFISHKFFPRERADLTPKTNVSMRIKLLARLQTKAQVVIRESLLSCLKGNSESRM